MIRKQDLGALFFYCTGFSKIRNLIFHLKGKPVTFFLAFHDIQHEEIISFEKKMNYLKYNTNVVSIDDFFSGNLSIENINIVITFDDGYKNWIYHVIPILQKLKMSATFFVSSGFINLSTDDELEYVKSKLLLNRTTAGLKLEDVKKIVEEGFIIGGHTVNHQNLEKLNDIDKLIYEIFEDKKRLESIIGKKVKYFAYPYGAYQNALINLSEVLKQGGYKAALTTVPGLNRVGIDPYLVHREIVRAKMNEMVFKSRVFGCYEAVKYFKKLFKIKYK